SSNRTCISRLISSSAIPTDFMAFTTFTSIKATSDITPATTECFMTEALFSRSPIVFWDSSSAFRLKGSQPTPQETPPPAHRRSARSWLEVRHLYQHRYPHQHRHQFHHRRRDQSFTSNAHSSIRSGRTQAVRSWCCRV